jgi:hypothetical protein
MSGFKRSAWGVAIALSVAFGAGAPAEAKQCWKKGAVGEAGDEAGAKFQVDEALLQAVDWGAWAAWMASGGTSTTPGGYSFGPRTYRCQKGGTWGVTCRGQATICKL